VKNAVTYALKRCAKDWGDQFGLSLYNKGSLKALIGATLDQAADETDVERDLPELHPDADEQPGGESQDTPQEAAQPPAPQAQRPAQAAQRQPRQQASASRPARQQSRPQVRAPEGAETDLNWLRHLIDDLIPSATTKPQLLVFWDEVDGKVRDGKCTDQDAKDIRAMVTQRAEELGFEKKAAAA
jgi:Rad52/22 family double-strand break repair protein